MNYKIIASIVTYNNCIDRVIETANSFLKSSLKKKLVIVDNNSPNETLTSLKNKFKADFIQHDKNDGFGAGHNCAIKQYHHCDYFLILNPDVTIHEGTLEKMVTYMDSNPEIGLLGPKILNIDHSIQYLCKKDPSFFNLFARRFIPRLLCNTRWLKQVMEKYEMRDIGYEKPMDIEYMSGCFMLFRKSVLDQVDGFDDNFFMYLEDADITRRVNKISRSVYYPEATITHDWTKDSYKSWKFTWISIKSSWYYFKKWGWRFFPKKN